MQTVGGHAVHAQAVEADTDAISPGSLVEVRDETWLVTSVEDTPDGPLYAVRGVSDFVKDTTASFYSALDTITPQNPEDSTERGRSEEHTSELQSRFDIVWRLLLE